MANLPSIQFPQGSGPYLVQLESGKLLGIELARPQGGSDSVTIARVEPDGPAAKAGIQPGSTLKQIEVFNAPFSASSDPAAPPKLVADVRLDHSVINFSSTQLPARSLPVHPSQIYAAINAALLCWLIWCIQPLSRWDGMTFLIAVLISACSRFLEEGIRSDEGGQLGTSLSIAQWISLIAASAAVGLILLLRRTPPHRVWDWSGGFVSS